MLASRTFLFITFFLFSPITLHLDLLLGDGQPERDREGKNPFSPRNKHETEEPDQLHVLHGQAVSF